MDILRTKAFILVKLIDCSKAICKVADNPGPLSTLFQQKKNLQQTLWYAHANHYPEELRRTFQGSGTDQRRLTIMNDDLRQAHYDRFWKFLS